MLRLKVRIERIDRAKSLEALALATSGFVGLEQEALLPIHVARDLRLDETAQPEAHIKLTADGYETTLLRYSGV